MKAYQHSKGTIFLLEIIINVLIFSILIILSLQFIIKAHSLTASTTRLHYAVNECNNIATLYQANQGSLDKLGQALPYSQMEDGRLTVYYNSKFEECTQDNSLYKIQASESSSDSQFKQSNIQMFFEDELIYEINATYHTPITPRLKED